jgi:hypothetical protein
VVGATVVDVVLVVVGAAVVDVVLVDVELVVVVDVELVVLVDVELVVLVDVVLVDEEVVVDGAVVLGLVVVVVSAKSSGRMIVKNACAVVSPAVPDETRTWQFLKSCSPLLGFNGGSSGPRQLNFDCGLSPRSTFARKRCVESDASNVTVPLARPPVASVTLTGVPPVVKSQWSFADQPGVLGSTPSHSCTNALPFGKPLAETVKKSGRPFTGFCGTVKGFCVGAVIVTANAAPAAITTSASALARTTARRADECTACTPSGPPRPKYWNRGKT